MLNTTSIRTVNASRFSQSFVKPCYDSYCFSNLPGTIEFLLTGNQGHMLPKDILGGLSQRYDRVILFFIDAFGWRFFERYAEKYDFLKTILAQGVVSKLTSQFPSTTAAHVSCIHTGLDVGQSGVYEWNYYEPLLDEIISPLLFSFSGDKYARDTIKRSTHLPPTSFFPKGTLYQRLKGLGVDSHILQYQAYATSTFSDVVFRGATTHAYTNLHDAFSLLNKLLSSSTTVPTYYFFYFDRIDTLCHNYGPHSRQFEEMVDTYLTTVDQLFYKVVHGKSPRTLFIMTADHGQLEVSPQTTFYLNRKIPGIARFLKTNRRGAPLVPAGSPRDMFLHVKEEHLENLLLELRKRLAGIAEVYKVQDLLDQHFFGINPPSPTLLGRLGNVVILPYKYETVWWYEEGKYDMHFLGHHGGLMPEEMEIPLLLLPL